MAIFIDNKIILSEEDEEIKRENLKWVNNEDYRRKKSQELLENWGINL